VTDLLELADAIWSGETRIEESNPFLTSPSLLEVASGVAFVSGFSNAIAFATEAGLVLIDSGGFLTRGQVHEQIRAWSDAPLHTVVFTHGHVDHVFGIGPFDEEAEVRDLPRPFVIAQENVPARFDRYRLTAGYNSVINQRQFQIPNLEWPTDFRYPDATYEDLLEFEVGEQRFVLHHAKGETDDHTWTWIADKKIICCGDLFIWCCPNAGNPQKAQRYPREWIEALRAMASLDAEVLLPGHGLPVMGAERVRAALIDSAALLESIVNQTLEFMNEGRALNEIVHSLEFPEDLLRKPYLKPIYDEPEFIARNVWRLYGGWYEGDPAELKPAPRAAVAEEIVLLAGGAERVAARAVEIADAGDLRLATHLIELAGLASDAAEVVEARARIYERRAKAETSTMAKGIFSWAASESRRRLEP
jgi:alkyl sulfatase BDS1-like metallo-beta-lactamase superfamily hydrolase